MKQTLDKKAFYTRLYKMLENVTPLTADCGGLCDCACCAVTDEITGMYLFPGEKVMYELLPKWAKLYDIDFTYDNGKEVELITCIGTCDRKLRPLSCRIFPLVPYAKRGEKLQVLMDIRGRGLCPLATAMRTQDLDPLFVKRVTLAMSMCMKVRETREFIYSLSELLDDINMVF
ncbi:MAG: hypothetical protein IJC06_02830 [Clostridia bacterium]|nr:hypothetical protein [Clostridia bacterium]